MPAPVTTCLLFLALVLAIGGESLVGGLDVGFCVLFEFFTPAIADPNTNVVNVFNDGLDLGPDE